MRQSVSDVLKSFAWPTYFVAFLLVATPVLDFTTNVWPLRPGDAQWRYGSVALFTGFMLTPLFGVLFAVVAATLLEHRTFLRTLSIVNIIMAPLILLLLGLFVLDVFQVRSTVPDEGRAVFETGVARAVIKYVTMAVALAWLGIVGIRRAPSLGKGNRSGSGDAPLVRSDGPSSSGPK